MYIYILMIKSVFMIKKKESTTLIDRVWTLTYYKNSIHCMVACNTHCSGWITKQKTISSLSCDNLVSTFESSLVNEVLFHINCRVLSFTNLLALARSIRIWNWLLHFKLIEINVGNNVMMVVTFVVLNHQLPQLGYFVPSKACNL